MVEVGGVTLYIEKVGRIEFTLEREEAGGNPFPHIIRGLIRSARGWRLVGSELSKKGPELQPGLSRVPSSLAT